MNPRIEEIARHPDSDPGNLFHEWLVVKLGLPALSDFGPDALLPGMRVDSDAPHLYRNVKWDVTHPEIGKVSVCVSFWRSGEHSNNIRFPYPYISYEQALAFVADLPKGAWEGVALCWVSNRKGSLCSEHITVADARRLAC